MGHAREGEFRASCLPRLCPMRSFRPWPAPVPALARLTHRPGRSCHFTPSCQSDDSGLACAPIALPRHRPASLAILSICVHELPHPDTSSGACAAQPRSPPAQGLRPCRRCAVEAGKSAARPSAAIAGLGAEALHRRAWLHGRGLRCLHRTCYGGHAWRGRRKPVGAWKPGREGGALVGSPRSDVRPLRNLATARHCSVRKARLLTSTRQWRQTLGRRANPRHPPLEIRR